MLIYHFLEMWRLYIYYIDGMNATNGLMYICACMYIIVHISVCMQTLSKYLFGYFIQICLRFYVKQPVQPIIIVFGILVKLSMISLRYCCVMYHIRYWFVKLSFWGLIEYKDTLSV